MFREEITLDLGKIIKKDLLFLQVMFTMKI